MMMIRTERNLETWMICEYVEFSVHNDSFLAAGPAFSFVCTYQ